MNSYESQENRTALVDNIEEYHLGIKQFCEI
jgi:hypothetical protein